MQGRQPMQGGGFQLPPLTPTARNVLIALFSLYVVELVGRNVLGATVQSLAWYPIGGGFEPWQPLTHFLVQGRGVIGVVIAGVVVYFFLPTVERLVTRRQLVEALLFGGMGGIALGLGLDVIGALGGGATQGWAPLVAVLIVLFGLRMPDATILLFFVLPVQARVLVWGTGALLFLFLLASFDLSSANSFGTFAGAIAWWYTRGPEGRRRKLLRNAHRINRELDRFTVLDGGRDDDLIH